MSDTIYIPCGIGEGAQLKSQLATQFKTVTGSENRGFTCLHPKKPFDATVDWLRTHYTGYSINGQWWHRPSDEEEW